MTFQVKPFFDTKLQIANISTMPRGVKKENLPSKICVICQRPFTWRKKWENCWDEVTTCSKSCNRKRKSLQQQANGKQSKIGSPEENFCDDSFNAVHNRDSISFIIEDQMPKEEEIVSEDLLMCSGSDDSVVSPADQAKLQRKQAKKLAKAKRRAQREGRGDPTAGQKQCDLCGKSVDLLIRCTIDQRGDW